MTKIISRFYYKSMVPRLWPQMAALILLANVFQAALPTLSCLYHCPVPLPLPLYASLNRQQLRQQPHTHAHARVSACGYSLYALRGGGVGDRQSASIEGLDADLREAVEEALREKAENEVEGRDEEEWTGSWWYTARNAKMPDDTHGICEHACALVSCVPCTHTRVWTLASTQCV